MDIDYSVTGADAAINKTKQLAGSVKRLESAWSRYNRAISTTKGGIGALSAGGSSGSLGGIIQGAIAFSVVQKAMESMASERVKKLFEDVGYNEMRRWRRLSMFIQRANRSLSRIVLPFLGGVKNLAKGLAIMGLGAGRMALGSFGRNLAANGALLGQGAKAAGQGIASGAIATAAMVRPVVQAAMKTIGFIFKRTPLGLLLGLATFGALLDERVSKFLSQKIAQFGEFVSEQATMITTYWSARWKDLRKALARFSGNAYYANSELDVAKAQKQLTPTEQKRFLENEVMRLQREDAEELIKRTKKEIKEYFDKMNEIQNNKFDGIVDVMRYEGRL